MINPEHKLSIRRQSELLEISRSTVYYQPRPVTDADLMLTELPQFGPAKNILSGFCLTTWVWLVVKWFASDPGLRSLSSDRCKVACSEDQAPCKTVVDG